MIYAVILITDIPYCGLVLCPLALFTDAQVMISQPPWSICIELVEFHMNRSAGGD